LRIGVDVSIQHTNVTDVETNGELVAAPWHRPRLGKAFAAKKQTRSSAVADRPRDTSCH